MFSLELSEEQQMLRDLAHEFAAKEMRPVAAHYDQTMEFPWPLIRQAHELGLMNTHVPEEYGGLGLGCLDECVLVEEMGWGDSGIRTAIEANNLANAPVVEGGSDALKAKYLGRLIEEPLMSAYALTEAEAGSDVANMRSTAVRKGDKYILNGEKMWITNAGVANWYFVVAYTDKEKRHRGMTAFVVEREWDGVEPGKKEINLGQRCSDTRAIRFTDVEVPAENVVGEEGAGFMLAMKAFDHTRPTVSAGAVGLARSAMEHAMQYATERRTFGKPIFKHQAVAFMLADMAKDIEAARLLVWKAAWLKDQGQRNTKFASMAKACAADICVRVCTDAVQVFGGYGYSTEYPVEKLMRESKIFQIYEGTSQIKRLIIAREMFERV